MTKQNENRVSINCECERNETHGTLGQSTCAISLG
jgi:hypothetical protein